MTKLEELARRICDDAEVELGSMGHSRIRLAIETALNPLLDALAGAKKAINSLLNDGGEAQYSKAMAAIDEQLSQWRKP